MARSASIYTDDNSVVMFIQGKKYRVTVNFIFDGFERDVCSGMPTGGTVKLEPTDEEVTKSTKRNGEHCSGPDYNYRHTSYLYKFGGFPNFIQNGMEPAADDGFPYDYICTIENGWGDSGNGNLFALIRDGEVKHVIVEASCC